MRHEPTFKAAAGEAVFSKARVINTLGNQAVHLLYESPFTDLTPRGPDGLFTSRQVDELIRILESIRATAQAA